jgi:hypothetical protein
MKTSGGMTIYYELATSRVCTLISTKITRYPVALSQGEHTPRSSLGASCFHDALCIRPNRGKHRECSLYTHNTLYRKRYTG